MGVLQECQRILGYQFQDVSLLQKALRHRSVGEDNNERLEFLGDAVLGIIITHDLYKQYPSRREGDLSRLRSMLVNGLVLSELAIALSLDRFLEMGSGEEKTRSERKASMLADAMEAVIKLDKESVDKIVKNDSKINALRSAIDNQITTVLVKRAPMAVDLRITISTMKISHDLERIGDLAKSVAKKVTPLPIDLPDELVNSLRRLGDLVQKQLKDVLDAYLNNSKDKAIEIWRKDEQVDDLTNLAMNEVANYLQKDKKNLEMATHLLFVTKNIERAGDHITNIAESLYYLIEGEYLEGARPKGKPIDS